MIRTEYGLRSISKDEKSPASLCEENREVDNPEREFVSNEPAEQFCGKRIARELHDGVIQELCYLRFQAQSLVKRLDGRRSEETPAAELLVSQVEQTLGAVRGIIDQYGKRNPEVDDLRDSILDFAHQVKQETGIKVSLSSQLTSAVSGRAKFECFRIIQESVRNAVKHSDAATVRIRLKTRGDWLGVRVIDNGLGMDPQHQVSNNQFGVSSMRHRAKSLGGEFQIWSRRNVGTIVQAVMSRLD